MNQDIHNGILNVIENMKKMEYIKPGDVPNIDLYMDQVTTFMEHHLKGARRYSEDKLLTKTMINNYTKNDLLPSPNKKKYSKDHIYLLIFIYYLKNILSISDIQKVLKPLTERFFGENGNISLEEIYEEIFRLESEQSAAVTEYVKKQFETSCESFRTLRDGEQKDVLQSFALISMLSFDVYVKKQLIEALIDEMSDITNDKQAEEGGKKKNTEEKATKKSEE